MKKILKTIGIIVVLALACVLLAVLTMPIWVGPVLRPTVNAAVPRFTQTDFKLEKLGLNPYTGRLEVGGLMLGNPKGYSEPVALSLSNLVVDVGMTTLCDKYIHVEEVTVEGLFASYVSGGENNVDNFKQIQYNAAGGKEKYEAKKAKAEAKAAEAAKDDKAPAEPEPEEDAASEKKLVIDLLTIRDVRVKYGMVTIPIPVDIVLKDIGKDSGGATFDEVLEDIWKAIMESASSIGEGMKAGMKTLGESAKSLGESAKSLGESAKSLGEGAKSLGGAIGSGSSAAASAAAKATTETFNKATDKAADLFKGLLK